MLRGLLPGNTVTTLTVYIPMRRRIFRSADDQSGFQGSPRGGDAMQGGSRGLFHLGRDGSEPGSNELGRENDRPSTGRSGEDTSMEWSADGGNARTAHLRSSGTNTDSDFDALGLLQIQIPQVPGAGICCILKEVLDQHYVHQVYYYNNASIARQG